VVQSLAAQVADLCGEALEVRQLTSDELRTWLGAGNEVGNHTWDHPCLDQCPEIEQLNQIRSAHAWLTSLMGAPPTMFAFPNGNPSPAARAELLRLNYSTAVLFDHRLTRLDHADPLLLSRLRVNATAPLGRFRLTLAGIRHPRTVGVKPARREPVANGRRKSLHAFRSARSAPPARPQTLVPVRSREGAAE
jgi:peptidoglycan/xylan/chitin deacetylase (PgdA/CDA1 family)